MGYAPVRLPRRVGPGGRTTEYPPNDWAPAEVERRIADEAVEWLYVFDPQGRQIARFRGTPDNVDLSDGLKGRAEGLYGASVLRNHVIVHNHPPTQGMGTVLSFPPSPSDLLMVVERDLNELIVVSGGDRYVIRRPVDHWPTDEVDLLSLIDLLQEDQLRDLGPPGRSRSAAGQRWLAILAQLNEGGWVRYERTHQTTGL